MQLLILGGSGFLSRYVAQEALKKGYTVFCLTRGNRELPQGVHTIMADRNDAASMQAALDAIGTRFDAVIDCICFNAEQARTDLNVFPKYTEQLIVISTDSVYHPDYNAIPRDENGTLYMDDDSYGAQKRRMELAFLKECPADLRVTLFRPPHMFGAGSELGCYPMHTRQKELTEQIRAGMPIRLAAGGYYRIQPLYAGDMAKAAVAAIGNPKTFHHVFCIAGPEVMTNQRYFEILGEILGKPVTFETVSVDEFLSVRNDGYCYFCDRVYDLSKLREAGLPLPATTLRQGLTEQIALENR